MADDFSIDASDLIRLAERSAAMEPIVKRELLTVVRSVGLEAEAHAKRAVVVDRGQLRRSITSVANATATGAQARVGTNLDVGAGAEQYARVIEFGRKPGGSMPPVAAIAGWLKRKGGDPANAYVVARSIQRRGTKAQPYLIPGVTRAVRESRRHVVAAMKRIAAGMGGGA